MLYITYYSANLNSILNHSPTIKNKLVGIVMEDMIGSHLEAISDLNKMLLKQLFKLSSPLIAATISMGLILSYECLASASLILT